MRFTCEYKNIQILIDVELTPNYHPTDKTHIIAAQDRDELEQGSAAYYSIKLASIQGEESALHISYGHILSTNPEELAYELENLLDQAGLLEKVAIYWKLRNMDRGPHWRADFKEF